jgi:phage baseplate assembly protein V
MRLFDFSRLIAPIQRKIYLMLGRAILTAVNHSGQSGFYSGGSAKDPQRIQVGMLKNETLTDIEHWQEYGFASYPKTGTAEALIACIDGIRDNAHAVCVRDNEYRPDDLVEGDSCIYDSDGARVRCTGGEVEIEDISDGKVSVAGGKVALGNTSSSIELLDLLDQLLTLLQGSVDLGGTASTGTLSLILGDLATLQTDLGQIKGSL